MARLVQVVIGCFALVAIAIAATLGYRQWQSQIAAGPARPEPSAADLPPGQTAPVRLSRQARANLGLTSKPLQLTTYWRTIDLPGVIVDRPGVSDRGVVAPVTGVVTQIDAFPGDPVKPEAPLLSIRLVSESLHASQLELFKATREIEISEEQLARLTEVAESGALPKSRIIDIENEIKRLNVTVEAYRQDLQARGLTPEGIAAATRGEFVTEFVVRAPSEQTIRESVAEASSPTAPADADFNFEVEALKVELGEQVESGQVLADLADHRALLIEGRAFKDDVARVQQAAKNGWEIEVDFGPTDAAQWPTSPERLRIDHVANFVDPETNTFAFFLPLTNQSQSYAQDGVTRSLWRFRPGGRVQLRVPVEQLENVFVVPRDAVVQEGPEAFVFRQNGDYFDRRPVRVLMEDRLYAVLANDGSVSPGFSIAQQGAASLNRVQKAQAASGAPNVHVHPDGTVHAAH